MQPSMQTSLTSPTVPTRRTLLYPRVDANTRLNLRIREVRIEGAFTNRTKIFLRISFSPKVRTTSGSYKTYVLDTDVATKHGWYLGLNLRSVDPSHVLCFELFRYYALRCDALLASVEVPLGDLTGETQVPRSMLLQKNQRVIGPVGIALSITTQKTSTPASPSVFSEAPPYPGYERRGTTDSAGSRSMTATSRANAVEGGSTSSDNVIANTGQRSVSPGASESSSTVGPSCSRGQPSELRKAPVEHSAEQGRARAAERKSPEPRAKEHQQDKPLPITPRTKSHHQLECRTDLDAEIEKVQGRSDTLDTIFQYVDPLLGFLTTLAEAVKVLHKQDQDVVTLFRKMMDAYKTVQDHEHTLNQGGHFSEVFGKMARQSEECYVFLSKYVSKNRIVQVLDRFQAPAKIRQFTEAFTRLQEEFTNAQIKTTTVLALDIQRAVASQELERRIKLLKPSKRPLGPKCHCLGGTRRESLKNIVDWIFRGEENESILWISGIAGVGKSSLIGTLHNSLERLGFSSRLAAFIRFDRSDYSDARSFVSTLAFLLANFDERFGRRIADAVERNRHIVQGTDFVLQVDTLLLEPLRDLSNEMTREERVVVLIDGIDECARLDLAETNFRGQLLDLFAKNKFKSLPFLRFALASRPERDIRTRFQRSHIRHFLIEPTSSETKRDIAYFFQRRLRDIESFHDMDAEKQASALEMLPSRAAGLFVWASTAVSFIGENVNERLTVFTDMQPPKSALLALTSLYEAALNSLADDSRGDTDLKENILIVLGLILASRKTEHDSSRPLTVKILQDLVQNHGASPTKKVDVEAVILLLGSVIFEGPDKSLRLIHQSFEDFLIGEPRHAWSIDPDSHLRNLAQATIECVMGQLEKSDTELEHTCLSSVTFQYATIQWSRFYAAIMRDCTGKLDDNLFRPLQRMMARYLGSAEIHCREEKEYVMSSWLSKIFTNSEGITESDHTLFIDAHAFLSKSEIPGVLSSTKRVFECLLAQSYLSDCMYRSEDDGLELVVYPTDNVYMSVFVRMASGSLSGEEIFAALEKETWPPLISLEPGPDPPIIEVQFRNEIQWRVEDTKKKATNG
ncbi:hypothetical protein VNI00_000414 [Paramarasmius palmivorus]|uniref:NACHT domain-containing protein n=1 Tax=Paramarasmius palmivorus TaxID=297713 RepID=A0AAW0EGE8_9AGAR